MIWWNLELKGDRVSLIRAVDYVPRISSGAVFGWFRMWRGARGSMNELMGSVEYDVVEKLLGV
jgi:hypothetical protein